MTRYYHGTVNKVVPSILKHGLVPDHKELRWFGKLHYDNPADEDRNHLLGDFASTEPNGVVYLSDALTAAYKFAYLKSQYLRAKPGERVRISSLMTITKGVSGTIIPDAKPIVLEVSLHNPLYDDDPQSCTGWLYHGTIDPKYIKIRNPPPTKSILSDIPI